MGCKNSLQMKKYTKKKLSRGARVNFHLTHLNAQFAPLSENLTKMKPYKTFMHLEPGSYILTHSDQALTIASAALNISREKLHAHPDFHLVKGEGSIGIDVIREIGYILRMRPAASSYKIFLIEEFHLATEEAQNAFLKMFEEPPEYAYIFLITPYIDRLLKTVVSRAQIIEESRIKNKESRDLTLQSKDYKLKPLFEMSIGERFLWLDSLLKGIENKHEAQRTLLALIDQFLLETVKQAKERKIAVEALESFKDAKKKIEQGFPNPKLLVEKFLLELYEHSDE